MSRGGGADESRWNKFFDRSLIRVGRCWGRGRRGAGWQWEGPVKSFGSAEQWGVSVTLIYFLFFFLFLFVLKLCWGIFWMDVSHDDGWKKREGSFKVKLKRGFQCCDAYINCLCGG